MLAIAGLRTSQEQMTERKKGALVVREISADHALGPVHILRPPQNPENTKSLPPYRDAQDAGFVEACEQSLANKPFLEQADYGYLLGDARMKWHDVNAWPADEPSRGEFNRFGKAMSFYHRKDGALVAVMKWGWVLVSRDEGETWTSPVRPPTFVSGMAKAWPQRTGDGRYALLYNPHLEHRYPLVVVHGDDGVNFRDMRVVHGDVPPLRYPGLHKSPGPQYVRGISEWSSDGSWPDAGKALWVCYSVNKEDIWVSRVPLPLAESTRDAHESAAWNTYAPKWAQVSVTDSDRGQVIQLEDRDPADYARASRLLTPASAAAFAVTFEVRRDDNAAGTPLQVDLIAPRATIPVSFPLPANLNGEWLTVRIRVNCPAKSASLQFGNKAPVAMPFDGGAQAIEAIAFRTGNRAAPAPAENDRPTTPARYQLRNLVIEPQ
jgi:hypothetical protein